MDQQKLDYILDNALDELDDSSSNDSDSDSDSTKDADNTIRLPKIPSSSTNPSNSTPPTPHRPVFGPPRPPPQPLPTEEDSMNAMLREMEALLDIPTDKTENAAPPPAEGSGGADQSGTGKDETAASSGTAARATPSSASETDMDSTVTKMLRELSRQPADAAGAEESIDPSRFEALGEEMMKEMADGWEEAMRNSDDGRKGGGESSVDHAVNGMLRQLMGKELMYEPMKDICDKFPKWLVEHRAELSDDDYQKYGKQYQCFQRIVDVYERDPNNFERLSELMQDIQQYGQPPTELIRELAPGLEFDEHGMPKLDGHLTDMGGFPPFPPNEDADCCTM